MKPALLIVIFSLLIGQAGCKKKPADPSADATVEVGSASEGDRSQARVLLDEGKQYYRDDRDEKAIEVFQEAIKLDPDLAEAHFRLGLTFDALGQEQEAVGAYKKAIEKYKKHLGQNNEDAEAHYNLGQTYASLSLYNEAVGEYRQATKLKSDDADIYYDLGEALTKLARYDEAVAAFSKSLEIDPDNYRAEDALEEAREGVKRVRAGRKHQEDLLKKQKEKELKEAENANANANSASPGSTAKPTPSQ